jgi:hypothetical protein
MQGNNRSAFATPSTWEGYAGRNFETELASFLLPDSAGATARKRKCGRKKRAATVEVLVLVCSKQGAAPLASCTGKRRVQALSGSCLSRVRRNRFSASF